MHLARLIQIQPPRNKRITATRHVQPSRDSLRVFFWFLFLFFFYDWCISSLALRKFSLFWLLSRLRLGRAAQVVQLCNALCSRLITAGKMPVSSMCCLGIFSSYPSPQMTFPPPLPFANCILQPWFGPGAPQCTCCLWHPLVWFESRQLRKTLLAVSHITWT